MAEQKTNAGYEFLVQALKADNASVYRDLKAKADEKGLSIFPVMFGRAKAMLGLVRSAKRGQGRVAKGRAAKAASAGKAKPVSGRRGRPVSGSSKSGQVRALLRSGMSAAEIAKKVGCTVGLVYNVKSTSGASAKRGAGRPPKSTGANAPTGFDSIVAAVRESTRESERLRRALEQIRVVLDGVA